MAAPNSDLSTRLAIIAAGLTFIAMMVGLISAHSTDGKTGFAVMAAVAFLVMCAATAFFLRGRRRR